MGSEKPDADTHVTNQNLIFLMTSMPYLRYKVEEYAEKVEEGNPTKLIYFQERRQLLLQLRKQQ